MPDKTYAEARREVPADATLSCTFGYPARGGYAEYWHRPDGTRQVISNGSYLDDGRNWTTRYLDKIAA